jgi:uncharacterized protein (TIGR03437 family)
MLFCSVARGQAPSYSAAGIVNAVGFTPGPFAPNSAISIFGTNLCMDTGLYTGTSTSTLPTQLDNVSVFIDNRLASLLMVSQTQINVLIPPDEVAGTAQVRVVRQGVSGPTVSITLAATAPNLFPSTGGYILAENWNNANALITADAPAKGGDTVILFATGLGAVQIALGPYDIPANADLIVNPSALQVLLNGTPMDPIYIKYAGLTPGFAGLYQINLLLPMDIAPDPQIQVVLGGQSSQPNLKLAVRQDSATFRGWDTLNKQLE